MSLELTKLKRYMSRSGLNCSCSPLYGWDVFEVTIDGHPPTCTIHKKRDLYGVEGNWWWVVMEGKYIALEDRGTVLLWDWVDNSWTIIERHQIPTETLSFDSWVSPDTSSIRNVECVLIVDQGHAIQPSDRPSVHIALRRKPGSHCCVQHTRSRV